MYDSPVHCAPLNYKFTGKERDTETGNDDFGARYYSWRFGRWLSSDWSAAPVPVPYANLTNPQTLNLYSMVADDPESSADLDGHQDYAQSNSGNPCYNTASAECAASQKAQEAGQAAAKTAQNTAASLLNGEGMPGGYVFRSTVDHTTTLSMSNQTTTVEGDVVTTTTTVTVAIYENGKFSSAGSATSVSTMNTFSDSEGSSYTESSRSLGYGAAARAFGAEKLGEARDSSLPGFDEHFAHAMANDIRAHPFAYAMHAAGLALPFLKVPQAVEGILTGVEALITAHDLQKEAGNQ